MRAPVRSESDAFRLAIGVAGVITGAALIGWLASPVAGAAFAVGVAAVAALAYLGAGRRERGGRLRAAQAEPHTRPAAPGTTNILVIANEPLAGPELVDRIVGGREQPVQLDVLAPVLTSRTHFAMSDTDREIEQAQARLSSSLAWARRHGLAARGEVGDPSPIISIEDELRESGADEVIVVTADPARLTWQERRELRRLRHELDVPVTQVFV